VISFPICNIEIFQKTIFFNLEDLIFKTANATQTQTHTLTRVYF